MEILALHDLIQYRYPGMIGSKVKRNAFSPRYSNFYRHDAHAVSSVQLTNGNSWTFFGLFDGYNGWHTSDFLSSFLIPEVLNDLVRLCSKYEPPSAEHTELGTLAQSEVDLEPLPQAMIKIIKNTFQGLDGTIVNDGVERVLSSPSKSAARIPLSVAQSGSSALLAFFDSDSRLLRIALTGNSRAVLGRRLVEKRKGECFYDVHVLTTDQDAHNPTEEARLTALHPNENVIEKGHVLGCRASRAFGLAMYKWSREIQDRLHNEYLGDRPPENLKTPPYITAEPEITTITVKSGDFLVMASSGLWNCLTNEEVVGLVGLWLNREMNAVDQQDPVTWDKHLDDDDAQVVRRDELPASMKEDNTVMYRRWRAQKRFLCVDDNAAGHLARNALGGADRDLTAALLSMTPPRSLRYRCISSP